MISFCLYCQYSVGVFDEYFRREARGNNHRVCVETIIVC